MKVRIKELKRSKKGFLIGKTENGMTVFLFSKDLQKKAIKSLKNKGTVVLEVEERQGKKGKYLVALSIVDSQKDKVEVGKSKALQRVLELEEKVNNKILFREKEIRLAIINAVVGGNMLLVGPVGTGKSAIAELVCSGISDNYGYWQFSRHTSPESVLGGVDLKAFKEDNKLIYNVDDFISKDFLIFDEFLYADGKTRSLLNDALVARRISDGDPTDHESEELAQKLQEKFKTRLFVGVEVSPEWNLTFNKEIIATDENFHEITAKESVKMSM